MADKTEVSHELQIKFKLQRDESETSRTISVPNPPLSVDEDYEAAMVSLRADVMSGSLSGVIQPSSWRDGNENEEPWSVTGAEFTDVYTTKRTYDIDHDDE